MITPGPVVITVAFIGYLVGGPAGALLAAAGVFLPCWLFVVIVAPWFRRLSAIPRVKFFVAGVTASACGAIAGATWVLGRRAIVDVPTIVFGVSAFLVLRFAKKIPEPAVIAAAAAAGLAWRFFNPTSS
jgi:chromate transporter